MKAPHILFENKVFSKVLHSQEFYSSVRDDFHRYREEEIYIPLENASTIEKPYAGKMLYQYDAVETYHRNERKNTLRNKQLDLALTRKVIANEHYPTYGEHWYLPDDCTPVEQTSHDEEIDPSMGAIETNFLWDWGRLPLVRMVRQYQYDPALPELREIALHDDSRTMRITAFSAMGVLTPEKATPVMNEVLFSTRDRELVLDMIQIIGAHGRYDSLFIPTLRKKFEDFYLDYSTDFMSRRWFGTVPHAIISLLCVNIFTAESLALIEEGIRHPLPHIEKHSQYALATWIERFPKDGACNPKLFQQVCTLHKKYDFHLYETDAWKKFKKIPTAGGC